MTQDLSRHVWRFFRSGGFDQVRIDRVDDLRALSQLDLKLWAALACPVHGLEFDERTLEYIDTDKDGRIRVPEVLGAVDWALERLGDPEVLFRDGDLPLAAISDTTESGKQLRTAAARMLANLGKPSAGSIGLADTADMAQIFPPHRANGDGIITAQMTTDTRLQDAMADIIAVLGAETDRSGEPGVSGDRIAQFFADAASLLAWDARIHAEADLQPLGDDSGAAVAAFQAVADKLDDFFMRTQFAAYDKRADQLMNGSEADLGNLAAQQLSADNAEARRLPLAQVSAGGSLPLSTGINPAWQGEVAALRDQVLRPLLGAVDSIDLASWQSVKSRLGNYVAWLAEKPALAVESLGLPRLADLTNGGIVQAGLMALVDADLAVKAEADSFLDVDKLLRLQRNLVTLLNNFVALKNFYTGIDKAIFQAGTLYLDNRSFDLCVRVTDVAKHASLAGMANTYLAYCDCTRQGSVEKMTVVVAVTAGSVGNLLVGRNGVFYDRKGVDWDATITRIVENPISLREAFWSPYRRAGKLISEQMLKMAAAKDQALAAKTASGVGGISTAATAPAPAAPASAPAPFDLGKTMGIFAAIGLAIGALGTALASILSGFLGLKAWQMPLALIGLMLLISGPAMIIAWFKLRTRSLGPILDATAWAVNTSARVNIPFGTSLTQLAKLPEGSERALIDPYQEKSNTGLWVVVIFAVLACAAYFAFKSVVK